MKIFIPSPTFPILGHRTSKPFNDSFQNGLLSCGHFFFQSEHRPLVHPPTNILNNHILVFYGINNDLTSQSLAIMQRQPLPISGIFQ